MRTIQLTDEQCEDMITIINIAIYTKRKEQRENVSRLFLYLKDPDAIAQKKYYTEYYEALKQYKGLFTFS